MQLLSASVWIIAYSELPDSELDANKAKWSI